MNKIVPSVLHQVTPNVWDVNQGVIKAVASAVQNGAFLDVEFVVDDDPALIAQAKLLTPCEIDVTGVGGKSVHAFAGKVGKLYAWWDCGTFIGLEMLLVACLLFSGCMAQSVPKTTITGSIAGQPFAISTPKDSSLQGLSEMASTNGSVSIQIQSLQATMNPAVITMTGDAEAKIIGAVASGVSSALGTAAGAAAASSVK